MSKKTIIIIVVGAFLLFAGSIFLFLKNREDGAKNDKDIEGSVYRNEEYRYRMIYPLNWEVEEKRNLSYFYSLSEEDLPKIEGSWDTYKQIFGVDFKGVSPLTYIDGQVDYNIEKIIYPNKNGFTAKQWYELAALVQAWSSEKISEADFIKISKRLIEKKEGIKDSDDVFDPWFSRGEEVEIEGKKVIKASHLGDFRYDGYQYYVLNFQDYIFVFSFGYGGPVVPREMWERSDNHVRNMISSLGALK